MADSTADDGPTAKEPQTAQIGLALLFNDHAYSEILELILGHLGLSDTAKLLRVNKHVNQVFTSSSRLQLSYRKSYHAIPTSSTNDDNGGSRHKPISAELQALLEKEERLESLKPTSIKCIHISNSTMFGSDSGYLLFGERLNQLMINPTDEKAGYQLDSFSIWKISSTENGTEDKSRGGIKHQGYYRWRYNLGKAGCYNMITMCVEDNVVAVVREFNKRCCAILPPNSDVLSDFRIYLYQLLPPTDTLAPAKGTYEGATRHPEAAMGFIEVKLPARYHLHQMKAQLAPGGRVGLMLRPTGDADFGFLGVWDWKNGVSLGKIAPSPKPNFPDDFRFFGNFVIISVFRTMDRPTPMEPKNSTSKSKLSHRKDRQNRSSDVAKKMSRGYKVRGRTGPIPSRHNRDVDDDEEEDNDSDEDENEAPKRHVDGFCSLEIYKILDPSKGMKPSGFAYRAHTEIGHDPSEPSTWDYQDIPICEPIVSFLSPPFNMMPAFPLSPIDMLLPPEPMISPSSCDLGEVHIDDALLKGERDGVMTFTILASTPGPGGDTWIQCQGVISLREIVHQVTLTLTARHRAEGGQINEEKDLATMWSQDLSVQKALNRLLELDDDVHSQYAEQHGWETDSGEEGISLKRIISQKRHQPKKGKSQYKGRNKKYDNSKYDTPSDDILSGRYLNGTRTGKDKVDNAKSVMKYIHHDKWAKSGSFRFSPFAKPPTTFGTKVFLAEPNYEKIKAETIHQVNSQFIPKTLIMRDFNSNVVDNDTYSKFRFRVPLGLGGVSLKNFNLGSDDSQMELKDTIMGECKLLKPIALPKFSKSLIRCKSIIGDKKISTHDMFEDEVLDSHLKFRESKVDLMWDTKRKLLELHFDGSRLIMYMQNGATIMAFD
ncbi:hypothetical protein I204_04730 [Kwoniella mangroviensis CBS 8886]|uniref:uncharacterized protein n=1 Tax=Kwoniella mangroviensis CBS 8507 TaxID=1296122 RepID=UPI00080CCF12|nr:uncharacterized protein I203_04069 [Kwoniella mangroviensis CBS 8507]OCF66493.1 hypothetical protein I203_04069 [Kwoniella mangroviensis CBS 8507]OCF74359.1 hypothetical protein I204_04730 [Kwoniella mangroviensis CBS 8886]